MFQNKNSYFFTINKKNLLEKIYKEEIPFPQNKYYLKMINPRIDNTLDFELLPDSSRWLLTAYSPSRSRFGGARLLLPTAAFQLFIF